MQDHITGLPAEVAATPFGQMIMPMLQPALEARLGNANAVSIAPARSADSGANTDAQPAVSAADSVPRPGAAAEAAIDSLRKLPDTGDGEQARKAFQAALTEEMARVQAEGVADEHEASAEALKRVMVEVGAGLVSPPA